VTAPKPGPLEASCPYCGANAGDPCMSKYRYGFGKGFLLNNQCHPHAARIIAVAQKAREEGKK